MSSASNEAFISEFADKWIKAWNSHETEQLIALLHPDIEWKDLTFWPEVIHGHDALRIYIEKIWEVMHDVNFVEIQRFYAADALRGIVLFRQFGSASKKLGTDGKFDTHGCDIFMEFKDGKLSRYLASYDIVDMMCQMGALPPRGNKVGGAYLLSLMKR